MAELRTVYLTKKTKLDLTLCRKKIIFQIILLHTCRKTDPKIVIIVAVYQPQL